MKEEKRMKKRKYKVRKLRSSEVKKFGIKKNVDIPDIFRPGVWKEVAVKMQINDSVFVKTRSNKCCLLAALRRLKAKGISRPEKEGLRVWRIK